MDLLQNFIQLGISEELQEVLQRNGIHTPTPIQERAIPHLLEGKDVMAQAQTGTGKTISFILPIIERLNLDIEYVQALIISPTRELALQITSEFEKYKSNEMNILAVYGGQDVERQLKKLKGTVHVVVGTPGRLLDHIRKESIDLRSVSMLVLDEADQMLHIGFIHEVEAIMKETSPERQTMLFSATLSKDVTSLAKKYMKQPITVKVANEYETLTEIKQIVYETTDRRKQAKLTNLLDEQCPFLAVIFCRTKRRASKLYEGLKDLGYNCDELHGDLSQAKRERVMERFRKAEIQYLIATDVAARGLDVEGVTHVFNYDIPEDVDSYIHRIGRTGRAGGEGVAITIVAPKDFDQLRLIEKGIQITLPRIKDDAAPVKRQSQSPDREIRQDRKPAIDRSKARRKNKDRRTGKSVGSVVREQSHGKMGGRRTGNGTAFGQSSRRKNDSTNRRQKGR